MFKKLLSEGVILYTFNPDAGRHFGYNITALIDENNAILIDTAYEEQALFHDDHIYGLKVLPKVAYVHIGDELLFSNNGEPLLPSIDFNRFVKRYFESLVKLKEYGHYRLIPSHGTVISEEKKAESDITNRIAYLNAILENSGELTFEEATKECECPFLHRE